MTLCVEVAVRPDWSAATRSKVSVATALVSTIDDHVVSESAFFRRGRQKNSLAPSRRQSDRSLQKSWTIPGVADILLHPPMVINAEHVIGGVFSSLSEGAAPDVKG